MRWQTLPAPLMAVNTVVDIHLLAALHQIGE
jgi:hypothetical protein